MAFVGVFSKPRSSSPVARVTSRFVRVFLMTRHRRLVLETHLGDPLRLVRRLVARAGDLVRGLGHQPHLPSPLVPCLIVAPFATCVVVICSGFLVGTIVQKLDIMTAAERNLECYQVIGHVLMPALEGGLR